MKFAQALNEEQVKVNPTPRSDGVTTPSQKIWARGIKLIKIDEGNVPDVHGIPPGYDHYGRGGFEKSSGRVWLDGGPSGSATGHPNYIENGFYWGIKYPENTLYLAGRVRGDANTANLVKHLNEIVLSICTKIGAPPKEYKLPMPGAAQVVQPSKQKVDSQIMTVRRTVAKPQIERPSMPRPAPKKDNFYSNWG
mgnify:CR=1 FL=1